MKTNKSSLIIVLAALVLSLLPSGLFAQDGSWAVDADGTWSTAGNWLGSTIADGVGSTASFTNTITATRTVTMDTARTNGNLVFAGSAALNWTLTNSAAYTLNSASGLATITVSSNTVNINANSAVGGMSGTNTVLKNGVGGVNLPWSSTYSGGTVTGAKQRAYVASCVNNMRQIAVGSAIYVADNQDWLMPLNLNRGQNVVVQSEDLNYVWSGTTRALLSPSDTTTSGSFDNLGFLFPMKLLGNGQTLFCPSYAVKPGAGTYSMASYLPLLTPKATSWGGAVYSSYSWNPWTNGAAGSLRAFQKTSDFRGGSKVLAFEHLVNANATPTDMTMDPNSVAHDRIKIEVVMYSDYSVKAAKITPAIWAAAYSSGGSAIYYPQLATLLTVLEAAH